VSNTFTVGLTGGIGSGKSTVANCFAQKGIVIVDTDKIARDVVAPGQPVLKDIESKFSTRAISSDGSLNRAFVRKKTFENVTLKQWLNQTLHPLIRNTMNKQINNAQSPYCIVDVPLLTENKMQNLFNRVLVVDCPEEMQLKRATQRDDSDEEGIKNIIKAQASREERCAIADDIILNDSSVAKVEDDVTRLHTHYLHLSQQA
jgi:dephospho-CoA kinase